MDFYGTKWVSYGTKWTSCDQVGPVEQPVSRKDIACDQVGPGEH